MLYAVTPTLWVGDRFPSISTSRVLLDCVEDPYKVADLIHQGSTVVVPSEDDAAEVLTALGLSAEEVQDRLRKRTDLGDPKPYGGEK